MYEDDDDDEEWLTTKKRGRDDRQIQQDQQRAKLLRQQQRKKRPQHSTKKVSTLITSTTATKTKSKTQKKGMQNKKKTKKQRSYNSDDDDYNDDDDDYDEDSFIVDNDENSNESIDEEDEASFIEEDDDDDDDDDDGDDDDDDDDRSDPDIRAKKPSQQQQQKQSFSSKNATRLRNVNDIDCDSSSQSSTENGFFSSYTKKRTSKAIPLPSWQQRKHKNNNSTKPVTKMKVSSNNGNSNNPFLSLAYDRKKPPPSSSSLINHTATTVGKGKNTVNSTKNNVVSLDNSDSDTDMNHTKQVAHTNYNRSKPLQTNSSNGRDDNDDSDSMMSESKLFEIGNDTKDASLVDHELEDTPLLQQAIRKKLKTKKLKSYSITSSTDDDDDEVEEKGDRVKHANMNIKKSNATINIDENDYCSDIDEAIAIAYAIEKSNKKSIKQHASASITSKKDKKPKTTSSTTAKSKKTITSNNKPKNEIVYLEDSFDDAEDDDKNDARNEEVSADYVQIMDDNDDDDNNNEDARAAKSILETANLLSLQILQTMSSWTHGATDGMIVDGALALSTVTNNSNKNTIDLVEATNRNEGFKTGTTSIKDNGSDHTWISNETMAQILPSVKLSEYQLIGINWIALLHNMKCEVVTEGTTSKSTKRKQQQYTNVNGILADEMGLGKTCQTIAFLSWLKHTNEVAASERKQPASPCCCPHLVIAPASVVSNWEIEFKKFAPHLNVVKYHGTMNERLDIQAQLKDYIPNNAGNNKRDSNKNPLDVIIAPVTYFQQEKSDDRYFLKKFQYDYMIVDEAHLLKNSRGMRYKSLDRFKTMHRLLLTGTPVQNSPKELMSLLCFLMPLFSRKNSDEFDDTQGHDGGESMLQYFVSIQEDNNDIEAYRKLKQLFSPFVLRRRKVDVLSQILPPKEQRVEFVELDELSRIRYNSIIAEHVESKKSGSVAYEHLFTQLRKAAHHPLMLRSRYVTPKEKEHLNHWFYQYGAFRGEGCTKAKVAEEIEKFTDFDIHLTASELIEENPLRRNELDRYVLNEQDLFCSAKFVRLREILPELIRNGHRILIFSVWTTCLDLLGCLLEQMGLEFLRMDGQTAVSDRQSLIDQFNRNTSIPLFLLSTKACGLGLNLTSADTCIQHDLDFNPFNDLQAEDRCHRIGQTKKVTIIKMVSKDTVDEDIYRMQQRKAKMNAAIMDNDTSSSNKKSSATNEQKQVLEIAVNRYLQSPKVQDTKRQKVSEPTTTESTKENSPNVECIEIL